MTTERPDVDRLIAPLKGFQRRTVDYVFQRMYRDPDPAYRFLVADEVGLGKTLIARGIIAKAIDHLWDTTRRLDVVYVCSNVAIAQQNIKKLATSDRHLPLATRLTLLPQQLKGLDEHKLNFVSFTPGTSFDLKSRGGKASERVILYWLLRDAIGPSSGLRNLLQATVGRDRWKREIAERPELDDTLREEFIQAYEAPAQRELRHRVTAACDRFHRYRDDWPDDYRWERNALIGDLRMLLARTCVSALEPDLIILDEFQRFRHLLHGDDEMSQLARTLWSYVTPENQRARVLLLSATPYRMYSTDGEVGEDDHYPDFIQTTRFLFDDDETKLERFERRLRTYRKAVHAALRGDDGVIERARDDVQEDLRRVMVRTERVSVTEDREAMMREPRCHAPIGEADVKQWLFVDELSRAVGDRDTVEMWKSAPYLPQFMRSYKLKEKLQDNLGDPGVVDVLRRHEKALLKGRHIARYRKIDPANARLRSLMTELLDADQWQLLWVPPTLPYWPLGGPFATNRDFTKRLVFSAWHVVPDVVSAMLSYEAERRALEGDPDVGYRNLHEKHRGLLRFAFSEGRMAGMTTLALQYPSTTLADAISPKHLRAEGVDDLRAAVRSRLAAWLEPLEAGEGNRPDERWYWAAPALLDASRGADLGFLREWTLRAPVVDDEAVSDDGDASRFDHHVELLGEVVSGAEPLGPKPPDLADVVTDLALGAPGVLAMRALRPIGASTKTRQTGAAIVAEGFRSLFNQPIAMAVVRRLHPDVPYWQATLRYAIDGGLEAVLDEHFHQVWEQLAWTAPEPEDAVNEVANQMGHAASIKMSRVVTDRLSVRRGVASLKPMNLRTSFALRYGRVIGDDGSKVMREKSVREAFNSPYRPFVLASTSIGQEGLDFHPWCHAIVHWNLPGNPVDLEQREGRVHRYEGHAVRRNVAARFGDEALRRWKDGDDLWQIVFELAAAARPDGSSDLVPWWVSEGDYRVERRVPTLPYSKEVEALARLKRDLVAYRLAFGQPRQQELLELVHGAEVSVERLDSWTLDLQPERT